MYQSINVFIIAELGQAHDGSLGILPSYIDALSSTGVDAVKFQMHIAEAESSQYEEFRVKFSYVDKTRYDYWKRMGFSREQWIEIKKHCEDQGVEFLCSAFSNAAVDLLEEIGLKRYKVGSGETTNYVLLEKIARTGKEMILSSGMSSFRDIDLAIDFLKPFGNNFSILQCTTKYPTGPEDLGLNVIAEMKKRYGVPVGFSDHSGKIYPSIAAVALGANIIEVHSVFDKKMFGPDASSSLTIDEISRMVEGVRYIEKANRHPFDKSNSAGFERLREIFGKSLSVNKDLSAGHILTFDDFETKKPYGRGIPAKDYREIIGKKLKTAKRKYDFLNNDDFADS